MLLLSEPWLLLRYGIVALKGRALGDAARDLRECVREAEADFVRDGGAAPRTRSAAGKAQDQVTVCRLARQPVAGHSLRMAADGRVDMTSAREDPLAVYRRLCVRRGIALGGLASGRQDDFRAVLAAAALALDEGAGYDEPAVNARLKAWLDGPGAMVDVDHVELRRWLVDTGLVRRDGYGRHYARAEPAPDAFARELAGLAGVDLALLADEARESEREARESRQATWRARRDTTPAPPVCRRCALDGRSARARAGGRSARGGTGRRGRRAGRARWSAAAAMRR